MGTSSRCTAATRTGTARAAAWAAASPCAAARFWLVRPDPLPEQVELRQRRHRVCLHLTLLRPGEPALEDVPAQRKTRRCIPAQPVQRGAALPEAESGVERRTVLRLDGADGELVEAHLVLQRLQFRPRLVGLLQQGVEGGVFL